MNFYLAKTDPETYDFNQLEKEVKTVWDGVKNMQAQQAIREMKDKDCVIIYHSGGESSIVGWGYVDGAVRPDPKDPRLHIFDLRFGGRLKEPVGLKEIKETGLFGDFNLVRHSRLSTMAVPKSFVVWLKKRTKDFRP